MPPRRFVFRQDDVSTYAPHLGNPLAVVLNAGGLDEEAMLRCANRTNLAKTTFVLLAIEPAADYFLRIFTTTELPFAGRPVLGTTDPCLARHRMATPGPT